MGIHRGPNTVKDGLVFGYDTGYGVADNSTATRFYPGEATENLANTESLRTMANYGGGTTTYAEAPEKGPGWKKVTITAINGSNHRLSKFPYISHPTNTTRIYSLELDFNSTSGYYVRGDGFTGLGPNVSTSGVHSWTLTTTTNSGVFALFLNNGRAAVTGLNDVIYYRYYQVEAKGHATPFTATTRSSTASLIDLKRTTNIDVSNVSFDSTGQPTFDNTNDRITMPNSSVFNHTSELSIEAWVKFDGNSEDFIFEKGNVNTQYSLFSHGSDIVFRTWHAGDSGYQTLNPSKTTAGITNGQWHHIVGSWDGSTKRIYVDGVDKASVSKSGALTTNSNGAAIGSFGGTSSGYYFGGDIAIVKIYDKGLSATEIKQNFNAYKNRFDI